MGEGGLGSTALFPPVLTAADLGDNEGMEQFGTRGRSNENVCYRVQSPHLFTSFFIYNQLRRVVHADIGVPQCSSQCSYMSHIMVKWFA